LITHSGILLDKNRSQLLYAISHVMMVAQKVSPASDPGAECILHFIVIDWGSRCSICVPVSSDLEVRNGGLRFAEWNCRAGQNNVLVLTDGYEGWRGSFED
jgi:hypothetical protein